MYCSWQAKLGMDGMCHYKCVVCGAIDVLSVDYRCVVCGAIDVLSVRL